MSGVCRGLSSLSGKILTEATLLPPCPWFVSARSKFSKARIPKEVQTFGLGEGWRLGRECRREDMTRITPQSLHNLVPESLVITGLHLFVERSKEHEKYGGDPDQPHKLHIVTRVKSVMRRPYWEKEMVKHLGLEKAHVPVIHKNTPAVNNQLKFVKHLVRIEPLRTPYGLPAEQDMGDSYINTKGELIVRRLLQPVDPKAIES